MRFNRFRQWCAECWNTAHFRRGDLSAYISCENPDAGKVVFYNRESPTFHPKRVISLKNQRVFRQSPRDFMSTDASSNLTTTKSSTKVAVGPDFIRNKINRTRRNVKLAELAAGLLLFAAGSLLFLLTLAVVDHWIVGLSFTARLIAFLVYVAAAAGFLWVYVAPLLFNSINPLYAAKMIEQGQPTLKNSLLNFLFLSQNQQGTRKAVLDAVQTQAASDISSLSLEHLVDYSKAIRIGYVLAGLAVLFGLYTVLSPKGPITNGSTNCDAVE